MIGIDDSWIDPAAEALADFGSVDDGYPMQVMLVGKRDGQWIFESEVDSTYFVQAKAHEWKPGCWAKWVRMTVRVDVGQGIERGHELVVAAYPISRRWHHHTDFKPGNKKGVEPSAVRRAHPLAEERTFESEAAMHRWIDGLEYDLWEKGSYLTAGISRPDALPRAGNSSKGRKTFGVAPARFDDVLNEILRAEALRAALRAAKSGKLACAPPAARKNPGFFEGAILDEIANAAESYLGEAVCRALAGPVSEDSHKWLGKPVTTLADRIFRYLVYEEHRKLWSRTSRETPLVREEDHAVEYEEADFDQSS